MANSMRERLAEIYGRPTSNQTPKPESARPAPAPRKQILAGMLETLKKFGR